ncbi:hypothetical protein VPH35_137759 [Triticum aestivum]
MPSAQYAHSLWAFERLTSSGPYSRSYLPRVSLLVTPQCAPLSPTSPTPHHKTAAAAGGGGEAAGARRRSREEATDHEGQVEEEAHEEAEEEAPKDEAAIQVG